LFVEAWSCEKKSRAISFSTQGAAKAENNSKKQLRQ